MKHKHEKHKKGGRAKENVYNAKGSPEEREADDEKPSFKRGGHEKREKRAHGGKVDGHKKHHLGKRPRRADGGKSPYTSGHKLSAPASGKSGDGHESVQPEGD